MSVNCHLCLKYTGKSIVHTEGCALSKSVICRRCHHRGHLSVDCTAAHPAWERPVTLEELIPIDIRLRYKIATKTVINYNTERDFSELPDITTIEAPPINDYEGLGAFIKSYGIQVEKVTKDSAKARTKAIKKWAVMMGYRVVHTLVVPTISQSLVDEVSAKS